MKLTFFTLTFKVLVVFCSHVINLLKMRISSFEFL